MRIVSISNMPESHAAEFKRNPKAIPTRILTQWLLRWKELAAQLKANIDIAEAELYTRKDLNGDSN